MMARVYAARVGSMLMLFALAAPGAHAGKRNQDPTAPQLIARDTFEIAGDMRPGGEPDGNSYVIAAPAGLIVIDTGRHAAHRQHIESLADTLHKPLQAIINTHWHLDHVSGNIGLRERFPHVQVYASDAIDDALQGFLAKSAAESRTALARADLSPTIREELQTDLSTIEHGDALRPDIVIERSERLTLAGRELQFHVARYAATAADVWVLDPSTQIAFVGDLVTFPAPLLDTACVDGWLAALTDLVGSGAEIYAPGHGPVLDRLKLEAYRSAFAYLAQCVQGNETPENCAAEWAQLAGQIIKLSKPEVRQAAEMTRRYVADVLRPNGGNSAYCAVRR